jgi:NAD(P)-dependent dehydrogenase (short-subunit alcohol dehydrogenase family)
VRVRRPAVGSQWPRAGRDRASVRGGRNSDGVSGGRARDRPGEAGLADIEAQGPLGVVVYAAGAFDWAPADTADLAAWQNVFDVNLTAAAVLTRLALPPLLRAAPSALVYIGSAAGHQVFAGNAAYVASKHGLVALAGATFLDVRDRDVKVSVISPGWSLRVTACCRQQARPDPTSCCAPLTWPPPSASSSAFPLAAARRRSTCSHSTPLATDSAPRPRRGLCPRLAGVGPCQFGAERQARVADVGFDGTAHGSTAPDGGA